jgi:hypothetical protein
MIERVAGVRVAAIGARTRLGVTAYAADSRDGVDGTTLDYQEWASRPAGGRFGAVGIDAATRRGALDLGAEITRSVDAMTDGIGPGRGGGGPAAAIRATVGDRRHSLVVSGRYLGTDFVNPLARPEAAADALDGQRARDEAGVRLRYAGHQRWLAVRASADAWRLLSTAVHKLAATGRVDVTASRAVVPGLAIAIADHGIGDRCTGTDDDGSASADHPIAASADDSDAACGGRPLTTTARVRVAAASVALSAQAQHRLVDAAASAPRRHDLSAWLAVTAGGTRLRIHGQLRATRTDATAAGGEASVAASVDATLDLGDHHRLRLRADGAGRVDAGASAAPTVTGAVDYQWTY